MQLQPEQTEERPTSEIEEAMPPWTAGLACRWLYSWLSPHLHSKGVLVHLHRVGFSERALFVTSRSHKSMCQRVSLAS